MEETESTRLYCWNVHNRHNNRTINTVLSLPPGGRYERLKRLKIEADALFNNNNILDSRKTLEICVVCLIASKAEGRQSMSSMDVDSLLTDVLQNLCRCYECLGAWSECMDTCDYVLNKLSKSNTRSLRSRAKVCEVSAWV
jgi:hypothetical protein